MSAHPDQWYGNKTYSQHGEDLVLCNLFKLMGIDKPSYLDVGAHHPWNISNTALLYKRGSRGVNVEANPFLLGGFREVRSEDLNINVGIGPEHTRLPFYMIDATSGRNTFSKEDADQFCREHPRFTITEVLNITVVTLNELVDEYCPGGFPDLLSLDAEGLDYEILRSTTFTRSNRPKVICVEAIGTSTSNVIRELLVSRGYFQVCRMGSNMIFVDLEYSNRVM